MRGTPGGSQNLCTGSFVLSNVCNAPNGGRTPLNFSAACGVIGACSGCLANGSEESQLLIRTPSGPLKSGFQIPDKSGIPPAITPGFCEVAGAGGVEVWACTSAENAVTAAKVAAIIKVRIFI